MFKKAKEKVKAFFKQLWIDFITPTPLPRSPSLLSRSRDLEYELTQIRDNLQTLRRMVNTLEDFNQVREGFREAQHGPQTQNEVDQIQDILAQRQQILAPFMDIEESLPQTLQSWFNRDEQSLVRFFRERISYIDQSMKKVKDEQLINFSLFIPKRKTMPTDHLKTILLSIQGGGDNSGMFSNKTFYSSFNNFNMPLEEMRTNEAMSKAFENYTHDDIKNLFTHRYYAQDWISIVRWALDKKETIPVFKSLREINMFLKSQEIRPLRNPGFAQLPFTFQDLTFTILKNNQEVLLAGYEFNNCLRHNFYNLSDLIAVKKDDKLFALAEVNNTGNIVQIKGHLNVALSSGEQARVFTVISHLVTKNS